MATPAAPPQHSPWQSPVPYLFGGLAAMVVLIAFAVMILACSYWKLSHSLDDGDVEEDGGAKVAPPVVEEKYLVIMAGHDIPTFLATPTASSLSNKSNEFEDKIMSGGIQMGIIN